MNVSVNGTPPYQLVRVWHYRVSTTTFIPLYLVSLLCADVYSMLCSYCFRCVFIQVKLSDYELEDSPSGCIDKSKLPTLLPLLKASLQLIKQGNYPGHTPDHTHNACICCTCVPCFCRVGQAGWAYVGGGSGPESTPLHHSSEFQSMELALLALGHHWGTQIRLVETPLPWLVILRPLGHLGY